MGRLDGKGRLPLPEAAVVLRGEARWLGATLGPDRWELVPPGRGAGEARLDARLRVLVPIGVRHQLGLDEGVVISVAVDGRRLVLWPAHRLDDLLGEP